MVLRAAVEADLPAVVELANVAYRGPEGWATETGYIEGPRLTEEQLRRDLAETADAVLFTSWDDQGELLGTVWLEPKAGDIWYLGLLTVRPRLQDRRLGRELLTAAEEFVRTQGGHRVRITVVNVREALIAWYQRRGYRLTGEAEPFPYGSGRIGRPLRDDLEFLVLEKQVAGTGRQDLSAES